MKPPIIRPGDVVTINEEAFKHRRVKRVGYPMDYREIDLPPHLQSFVDTLKANKYSYQVEVALKKYWVKVNNFGGRERTVHFYEPQDVERYDVEFPEYFSIYAPTPDTWTVDAVRSKKTGIYHPPSVGGYEEPEYDPGYLGSEKTVRIARVSSGNDFAWYLTEDLQKVEN